MIYIDYFLIVVSFTLGLIIQYFIMRVPSIDDGTQKPTPYKIEIYSNEKEGYIITENGKVYRKNGQGNETFTLYYTYDAAYEVVAFLENTYNYTKTKRIM